MAPQQATLPLLHRFLGIGQVCLLVMGFTMKALGIVPLLGHDEFVQKMAYGITAISAVMILVAFAVLRPLVPARPMDQPVPLYWLTPAVATKVMPVWFVLEGAGVFCTVGYWISADPVALVASGLATLAFWLGGPMLFAKG